MTGRQGSKSPDTARHASVSFSTDIKGGISVRSVAAITMKVLVSVRLTEFIGRREVSDERG